MNFSPLYDNGSSLCSYVNESDIDNILNDTRRYNSLLDTKSKSCIGWNDKRPIRHFELVEKISKCYYNDTLELIKLIEKNVTLDSINNLLNKFSDNLISKKRKKLLLKYIIDRKDKIINLYKGDNDE